MPAQAQRAHPGGVVEGRVGSLRGLGRRREAPSLVRAPDPGPVGRCGAVRPSLGGPERPAAVEVGRMSTGLTRHADGLSGAWSIA